MRARRFLVGAAAVAGLALFGGAAIAQQDGQAPAQQAPGAQQQQQGPPGGSGYDCPEKGGQGQQETEV